MWKSVHCEVQGRGHLKDQIPCQDKTIYCERSDARIIALADGAGSASHSHYGAYAVIKFVAEDFLVNFDNYYNEVDGKQVKKAIMEGILKCLIGESQRLNCSIKSLASTLLAVAIKGDKVIILHIGDGVIGYLKDNQLKVASTPVNDEFANTTVFTTSTNALSTMKLIKSTLGSITGFILMSDGTEASMYNKREGTIASGVKKIFDMMVFVSEQQMTELVLESFETIIRSATFDDCSINLLINDEDSFKGYNALGDYKKVKLLNINKKSVAPKKQINKYNKILISLLSPKTVSELARTIYIKEKYLRKYIDNLQEKGFIVRRGNKYKTIITM